MKERFASLAEVFETLEQVRKENAALKEAIASKATGLAEVLGQLRKENKQLHLEREFLGNAIENVLIDHANVMSPGSVSELQELLDLLREKKPAEQEAS